MVLLGTIHPLEGDGINANFFEYLAKENKGLSSAEVWIPSTVIFEQGFAKAWYFSEKVVRKDGDSKRRVVEVKKRTGKECDLDAIRAHFIRDAKHDADVCAMFISHLPSSHDPADGSAVRFFDKRTLRDFLNPYVQKPKGLLQKFVRPKGYNNTVVQAIWSPTVLITEARRNRYSLMDKHVDVFSRAATFEGSSENCVHVVVAPVVVDYIRTQCEQVVAHFSSTEHLSITRMVLFFKVDHQNILRLLYPASIRIAEASRKLHPAKSADNVPLNLAVTLRGHKGPARGHRTPSPARDLAIRSSAFSQYLKETAEKMESVRKTAPQASDFNMLATSTVLGGWTPPRSVTYAARAASTSPRGPRSLSPERGRPGTAVTPAPAVAQRWPPKPKSPVTAPRRVPAVARPTSPQRPRSAGGNAQPAEPQADARLEAARRRAQPEQLQAYSHILPNTDAIVARMRKEAAGNQPTARQVDQEWEIWLRQQAASTAQLRHAASPSPAQPPSPQMGAPAVDAQLSAASVDQQQSSPPPLQRSHHYTYFMNERFDSPIHSTGDNAGGDGDGAGGEQSDKQQQQRQQQLEEELRQEGARRRKREEKEYYLMQELRLRAGNGLPLAITPLAPPAPPRYGDLSPGAAAATAAGSNVMLLTHPALAGAQPPPLPSAALAMQFETARYKRACLTGGPALTGVGSVPASMGRQQQLTQTYPQYRGGVGSTPDHSWLPVSPGSRPAQSTGAVEGQVGRVSPTVSPDLPPLGSSAGEVPQQQRDASRGPAARMNSVRAPVYTPAQPLVWQSIEQQYAEALLSRDIAMPAGVKDGANLGVEEMIASLLQERAEQEQADVQKLSSDSVGAGKRRGTQQATAKESGPVVEKPAAVAQRSAAPKSPPAQSSPRAAPEPPKKNVLGSPLQSTAEEPKFPGSLRASVMSARSTGRTESVMRPRRTSHSRLTRQVDDWAGLSDGDVRRIEQEAAAACADVTAYIPELVYAVYSAFISRRHCDAGELASGVCDFYVEPPESLSFLLTPQVLHGLLSRLHGRLVDCEHYCLPEAERPGYVTDSDDESSKVCQQQQQQQQQGLPWPTGPGKKAMCIAPVRRKKISAQQQADKDRRRDKRRELYKQEAEQRVLARRDQLLAPTREGAVARWPPPQTIPLVWDDGDGKSRPHLRSATQGLILPYMTEFIPIVKGESGSIADDFAAEVTAPSGRLFYAAKKHFYYQRLADIEGERAAEARRRQLELQEAAAMADTAEEVVSEHQTQTLDAEALPRSVSGVPMVEDGSEAAADQCPHCGCLRVLCLCDMTRVDGRHHHRVCSRHGARKY